MLSPAMATMLAVLTTDAAVDPAALQRALAHAVARHVRLPQRRRLPLARTTPCSCSPTAAAGAVDAARAHRRAHRGVRLARRADGARRRRRDQVRAGPRASARAPTPRRASRPAAVADSQLVQCSLNGDDPYWGRVLSELGASGALFDPERVDIAYNGVTVCRDGIACDARRGRARRGDGRRTRSRSAATCTLGARRGDGAHHRPLARVHRREPAHVVSDADRASTNASRTRARRPRSSPRRCRTSASSRARPS